MRKLCLSGRWAILLRIEVGEENKTTQAGDGGGGFLGVTEGGGERH